MHHYLSIYTPYISCISTHITYLSADPKALGKTLIISSHFHHLLLLHHPTTTVSTQSKQCDALTKELAKLKESKVAVQRQHRIQAQEMLKLKKDQQIMLTTMKVSSLANLRTLPHINTRLLSYSLTHSPTHSLTHSLTHQSFTHPLIRSLQTIQKSEVKKQQLMNTLKSELVKRDRVLGHKGACIVY